MKKLCILIIGFLGLLSFGLTMTTTDVQAAVTYEVTFQTMFDELNQDPAQTSLGSQTYNTTIQLETDVDNVVSPAENEYQFAFWVVNGVVRRDLPVNHTFTVIGDVNFIAVFSKIGEHAVLFMDSNAKLIDVEYVLHGANASDSALTLPNKPGYVISTSAKWSGSLVDITDDTVLTLQYEKATLDTFTLTVTNGSGTDTYNYNEVVTVTANVNGTPFSHWEDEDGIIISTQATYKFSMLENKELIAVFNESAEADAPRIILSDDLAIREYHRSYIAQFYIPMGYTLIDYGMLTLTEDKPIASLDTENVAITQGFKYFGETKEFVMSFLTDEHYSVRAYLVVKDGNNELHRLYSELNPQYMHIGPVDLGEAYNFAILAETGITTTGTTHIYGDIGISPDPAASITGFGLDLHSSGVYSTSSLVTGKIYASDYTDPTPANLTTAIGDMRTAYNNAAGKTADHNELHAGNLSGKTLAPGVYKWTTEVLINTDVTLDAGGDATKTWVFQISGNLTQAADVKIILAGGAVAENIVWQVAGEVNIEARAHFEGTILCKTGVHLVTGATLNGRILAQTAATLIANKLNE